MKAKEVKFTRALEYKGKLFYSKKDLEIHLKKTLLQSVIRFGLVSFDDFYKEWNMIDRFIEEIIE